MAQIKITIHGEMPTPEKIKTACKLFLKAVEGGDNYGIVQTPIGSPEANRIPE